MPLIWNTFLTGQFHHQFENKCNTFRVEEFPDLAYELCYFVVTAVNQILTEPGRLVKCHCDYFSRMFQITGSNTQQWHFSIYHVLFVGLIWVEFEWYQKLKLVQKKFNKIFSLWVVILHLLHACFHLIYHEYFSRWSFVWWIVDDARSLSFLFTNFMWLASSVGNGWWVTLFCWKHRNYEVSKHMLKSLIDISIIIFDSTPIT